MSNTEWWRRLMWVDATIACLFVFIGTSYALEGRWLWAAIWAIYVAWMLHLAAEAFTRSRSL